MKWVLPNALENRDAMTMAWFTPTRLSPFPPTRPELDDEEDEEGMKASMIYIVSLVDSLVLEGIPVERIILGGFSQGHAMALLTGLTSTKYAGHLGWLVGLSGYLPQADKIPALRDEVGLPAPSNDHTSVFLARGTRDMLVPKRYLTICANKVLECGVEEEKLTVKEYEGMGHVMSGVELRDLCVWLEKVVPPVE